MKKIYPWDKWFSQRRFSIRRGEHYRCSPYAMGQQIRNEARLRGLRVSLVTDASDQFVVVIKEAGNAKNR